jgi:hypothetical protein
MHSAQNMQCLDVTVLLLLLLTWLCVVLRLRHVILSYAEPAVRMAVTLLQRLGRHHAAAGMRLDILQPVAAFGTQLVLAAGKLLDYSSRTASSSSSSSSREAVTAATVAAGPLAAAGLQDSPEFLALTLLVLHGQLAAVRQHTSGQAVDSAVAGQQDSEDGEGGVQQQQQQQYVRIQDEQAWHGWCAEVQQYFNQVDFMIETNATGEKVAGYWEGAPCWQQHSSAEDIRLVLLLLLPLLEAAESSPWMRGKGVEESSVLLLLYLPVVLLQLAGQAWNNSDVALCLAALRTTAAAAKCLGVLQLYSGDGNRDTTHTLLLLWLQLVRSVLPDSSSDSTTAAAAAAAGANEAVLQQRIQSEVLGQLLEVLTWIGQLDFDWSGRSDVFQVRKPKWSLGPSLAAQLMAALERIVRSQAPAAPAAAAAPDSAAAGTVAALNEMLATAAAAAAGVACKQKAAAFAQQLAGCLSGMCMHPGGSYDAEMGMHRAGGFTEAATVTTAQASLPAQQQLAGLLSSAVKFAAAAAAGGEQQAEPTVAGLLQGLTGHVSDVVSSVQHTAYDAFLGHQVYSGKAGAVRCVEPLAAPWLLLLAKMVRQRALHLQQITPRVGICYTSSSSSCGDDEFLQVLQLLDEVAAALGAAAQLREAVQLVAQEDAPRASNRYCELGLEERPF